MELSNDKKYCPFCGAAINVNAKKCRFCNNWFDEEINCPYCAEKIKKSAKKCRYCGEWLDNNEGDNENHNSKIANNKDDNADIDNKKNIRKSYLKYVIIFILLILFIAGAILGAIYLNIAPCNSDKILNKVEQNLNTKYSEISNIVFNKSDINTVKRDDKGYTCHMSADIDNNPSKLEYSYAKVGFNDYNVDTEIILPDCYDTLVKNLLVKLVKDSKNYNISNVTSDVATAYETITDIKKDKKNYEYSCNADVTLNAKPGKAFVLDSWNLADASLKIKCKADYMTHFCKNGYTTCVNLTYLYNCENVED